MEQQVPLKTPDQLEVEAPTRYSDICGLVGDLYIKANLQAKLIEQRFIDRIRSLEAHVKVLIQENESLKRVNDDK